MKKILRPTNQGGYNFWCPGCKCVHHLDDRWTLEGTLEVPTIRPSVQRAGERKLCEKAGECKSDEEMYISSPDCHLYITNGKIEYLAGTSHELHGRTVDMVDF